MQPQSIHQPAHHSRIFRRDLLRDAALTLASVLLAFAALDDITTDSAATFIFERSGLAVCVVWLLIVVWHLVRDGHRLLGAVSVVVLFAAAWTGSTIGPGTVPFQFEYLVTVAGLAWFLGLAGILTGLAWHRPTGTRPNTLLEQTAEKRGGSAANR